MSVVLVVSHGESHIGRLTSISVERESGFVTLVLEGAVSLVDIQIVRRGIVGHQDVRLAIVVDIGKQRIETVITIGPVHAQLLADIGKGSIAVAVEEVVVRTLKSARAAHDLYSAIQAEVVTSGVGAGERSVFQVEIDIAGHKQIELAVSVVVPEGGAGVVNRHVGRTFVEGHTGLHRDIGKRVIVIVAVEPTGADVGHVEIGPAVVVVIADNAAGSPSVVRYTCARGDVGERAVMIVMEEGRMR